MKPSECISKRCEFRIATSDFKILQKPSEKANCAGKLTTYPCANCVHDISATALQTFPRVCDQDRHIRIFVQDLLDTTVVAARLAFRSSALCCRILVIAGVGCMNNILITV